jgi:hypothetical protein
MHYTVDREVLKYGRFEFEAKREITKGADNATVKQILKPMFLEMHDFLVRCFPEHPRIAVYKDACDDIDNHTDAWLDEYIEIWRKEDMPSPHCHKPCHRYPHPTSYEEFLKFQLDLYKNSDTPEKLARQMRSTQESFERTRKMHRERYDSIVSGESEEEYRDELEHVSYSIIEPKHEWYHARAARELENNQAPWFSARESQREDLRRRDLSSFNS